MKNYIQPGETLTVTAPGTTISGQLVVVGSIVGVANADAATGEAVEVDVEGVFELPKVSGDNITAGVKLYWNGTALTITAGTGSKPLVGFATEAAATGTTVVRCSVIPSLQSGPTLGEHDGVNHTAIEDSERRGSHGVARPEAAS